MNQLTSNCREMQALRARIRRSFGLGRITEEEYQKLTRLMNNLGQALDGTPVPEQEEQTDGSAT
jgi:phage-related minor tail protein